MSHASEGDAELRALLYLRCLPGLGDRRLVDLLGKCGSAEAALALGPARLCPRTQAHELRPIAARVERALRLLDREEVQLLVFQRPGYPAPLLELADPPVLLFARGNLGLLGQQSVAVVGTRRPTDYGVGVTEQLVAGLVRAGVVVWSGLARGIDSVAHRTALAHDGSTVAVLGSGIDVPYPREHAALLEAIAERGLVLSEFVPGEPPLPFHFPQRNRILARLAHGVLVVEARPDGGALITAEAGSSARPIMAVPGPIGRPTSLGPNRLIQEGAKLVVEVADILEEIGGQLNAGAAAARPSARRRYRRVERASTARAGAAQQLVLPAASPIVEAAPADSARNPARPAPGSAAKRRAPREAAAAAAVGRGSGGGVGVALAAGEVLHIDELAARSGAAAGDLLSQLLQLELAGTVQQLPGQRFRLATRPDHERHLLRRAGGN